MQNLLSEADTNILTNFKNKFAHLKDEQIVLYGLGEKTKLLLDNLPEFNFAALMDKNSVGLKIFNLPVIAPDEVLKFSKNIIIVCTYASCNIIHKRIQHLEDKGVNIYYFNGEKLKKQTQITAKQKTAEELKNEIVNHEVISFDIFDTLLTRDVPTPSDIFAIIGEKLGKNNFTETRITAETKAKALKGGGYTLKDIYDFISIPGAIETEINTELEYCAPKREVIDILKFAQNLNKQILITSDMYLPEDVIRRMLAKVGVNEPYKLYVSNECNMSKYSGSIYEYYKKIYDNKKILHIGDDEFSDINQAEKYGITAFQTTKKHNSLLPLCSTIKDKILLSSLLNKIDNCFSNKYQCISMEIIGYFVAPLIINYMNWLFRKSKELGITKILFIARDGYLLEKLYKKYPFQKPEGIYFYTSRRALAVTTIKTKQDIIETFNIFYLNRKITIKKFINAAFGVEIQDSFTEKFVNEVSAKELLDFILSHTELILDNASKEREEYLKYISSVINSDDSIGIINFVSSGTTQFFAEKLLGNNIKFFCFQTTCDIKKVNLNFNNLYALYGEYISPIISNNNLARHYHTLEAILTSPDEQFVKINNGIMEFLNNNVRDDFEKISKCHNGMCEFFDYVTKFDKEWYNNTFNIDLIDNITGMLFNEELTEVPEEIKGSFKITDGFSQDKEVSGLW